MRRFSSLRERLSIIHNTHSLMLFQFSLSNYSCIFIVVSHVFGNTTERGARANSARFGWLGCDISWGRDDSTIFIPVIYFNFNSVSHVLVSSLVASPVTYSFCWLEVHVLLTDFFITVFDDTALLVLWWILIEISVTDIRARSLKVNCLGLALLKISSCEVPRLEEDFAIFVLRRYSRSEWVRI